MSEKIYEARQYVDAVARVYTYYFAMSPEPRLGTTNVGDVIRAEGKTPAEAEAKLKKTIDSFCQTGLHPYSLAREQKQILSCQPVGKPTVELKISLAERFRHWLQKFGL